jgi:hypothetical protein
MRLQRIEKGSPEVNDSAVKARIIEIGSFQSTPNP